MLVATALWLLPGQPIKPAAGRRGDEDELVRAVVVHGLGGVTQLVVPGLEFCCGVQPVEGEGHLTTIGFVAVSVVDSSGALVVCTTATIAQKPLATAKVPPLACPASALPSEHRQCKLHSVFMDEFFLPEQMEPLAEGGYLATSADHRGRVRNHET
jgi:hypothetical protein